MNMIACTMALGVLGLGLQGGSEEKRVGYQVNVYEMRGLEWRGTHHFQLTPVAHQGAATVWLAPKAVAAKIAGKSEAKLFSPKPATGREVPAEVQTSLHRNYVAHLDRVADGPPGQASTLAFQPQVEVLEEWLNVAVECFQTGEGVLTQFAIDEMRLAGWQTYKVKDSVVASPTAPYRPIAERTVAAEVHVPEMIQGEIQGEWVVPAGHALIVGLGPHSQGGKLSERLAIIEPSEMSLTPVHAVRQAVMIPTPTVSPSMPQRVAWVAPAPTAPMAMPMPAPANPAVPGAPLTLSAPGNNTIIVIVTGQNSAQGMPAILGSLPNVLMPTPFVQPLAPPAPIAAAAVPVALPAPVMAMPPVPQRMLPTPINEKGEVVPLPPLPEAAIPADASAEPRGTPQAPHVKPEALPEANAGPAPDPRNTPIVDLVSH